MEGRKIQQKDVVVSVVHKVGVCTKGHLNFKLPAESSGDEELLDGPCPLKHQTCCWKLHNWYIPNGFFPSTDEMISTEKDKVFQHAKKRIKFADSGQKAQEPTADEPLATGNKILLMQHLHLLLLMSLWQPWNKILLMQHLHLGHYDHARGLMTR